MSIFIEDVPLVGDVVLVHTAPAQELEHDQPLLAFRIPPLTLLE
jgi:hypothetical protein